mgnify:CR=1 FL=1
MLNCIVLQGRLVADPELRQTPQGVQVASFRIACDRSFARQGEQRQADFFSVSAWRNTADFVCKYFHKGDMILVEGRLQTRTYQDKDTGKNVTAYDVVANNVNFCGGRNGGGNYSAPNGSAPASDYSRPAAQEAPAYSAGNADDFAIIDDSTDLPF